MTNQLKHISCTGAGIKGRVIDIALTGCDVVGGPNGSGKTTILLGALAARGGLADTDTDPARIYLGPTKPEAKLVTTWAADKATRRLGRDLVLSQRQGACKAANIAAEEVMGSHLVRWDLSDFTTKGDGVRANLLKQILRVAGAGDGWDGAKVEKAMKANDAAKPCINDLIAAVPLSDDLAEWFDHAVKWARGQYTERNRHQKEAVAKAKAMSETEAVIPPGTLANCRATVAQLEEELAVVREQIAVADQTIKATKQHKERGERLLLAASRATTERNSAEVHLRQQQQQRASLRDVEGLVHAEKAAQEAKREAESNTKKHWEGELATLSADLQAAKLEQSDAVAIAAAFQHLDKDCTCRHCNGVDPIDLTHQLPAMLRTKAMADFRVEDAEEACDLAMVEHHKLQDAAGAVAQRHTDAETALLAARTAASQIDDAITQAEARLTRASEVLTAAEADSAAWQAEDTPQPISSDELVIQRMAIEEQVGSSQRPAKDSARWQVEQHMAAQRREQLLQEAVADRELALTDFEAIKAMGKQLKELESKCAESAYQPICAAAQRLLDSSCAGLTVQIKSESNMGAVVSAVDWPEADLTQDTYVTIWELSDAQAAMVGGALAVAFAELSGSPWRALILDRLETIDSKRLPGFLAGIAKAFAEDRFDNFLGALVVTDRSLLPQVDGLHTIWTGLEQATAEAA